MEINKSVIIKILATNYKNFVLDKKEKSSSPTGGCFYSHEYNGVGCAVGCVVDAKTADMLDDSCDGGFYFFGWGFSSRNTRDLAKPVFDFLNLEMNEAHWNILNELQRAHDGTFMLGNELPDRMKHMVEFLCEQNDISLDEVLRIAATDEAKTPE